MIVWEDQYINGGGFRVAPGASVSGRDVPIPWAVNTQEVRDKALRVYSGTPPFPLYTKGKRDALWAKDLPVEAYIFQSYRDDQIYYLRPEADGSLVWGNRRYCGEGPSSYVELSLSADGTVHARATHG